MPLLFVVFIAVLVNFPSALLAQENATQIRGPRGSDAPPAPLTIGPLSPSDTLWRVAQRVRPDTNLSLYQVMYALYLKNPDAFLEGNLNHLRPAAVLTLPTLEEIQQVDITVARQKSEQDDQVWAARQKAASNKSQATQTAATASAEPTAQWQAELSRIGEQQRQELDSLRSQFAESIQLVDTIADENLQLKTSLAKVQQELELIKLQLGDDSAMQQQIELLLQQQAELLQAKAAQDEAAAEAENSDWQQWLKHPLAWVLAACIPALLILLSILLWVKKRSQHTEQIVSAATTETAPDPGYHSPLPPLDNTEIDDSLFEIDDALLEEAFTEPEEPTAAVADTDDLLEFDDELSFEDDSLLPAEHDAALLDDQTDADALDDFDPDNILSDTDLSALLAAADDDDVIELADDDTAVEAETPPEPLPEPDDFDIDDLIEEVDLDELSEAEPALATTQEQQLAQAMAAPAEAAEPVVGDSFSDADVDTQDDPHTEPDDSFTGADDSVTEVAEPAVDDNIGFDSSELDAFAESLAAEHGTADTLEQDNLDPTDEALLNAELTELLDQVNDASDAEPVETPDADELAIAIADQTIVDDGAAADIDEVLLDDTDSEAEEPAAAVPDLLTQEDDSVDRPSEAALSVENPSKMLDQYPQLELSDEEISADQDTEALLSELDALADDDLQAEAQDSELELDPIPDAQFDSLMSELEAMADNLDAAEHELEQQSDESLAHQLENAQQADNGFDFTDDDFVEIDTLLASAGQQEQDTERFNKLNVDVGLEEYAAIIGEHEQRDVDTEDNGFSAKLDLVRAYIEMDDSESANLLLDEIAASEAPEHIKDEAQRLRQ